MAQRYIVETAFYTPGGDNWENCWREDAGQDNPEGIPTQFDSQAEAVDAIRDHITDCINAVEAGDMEDSPDATGFRIVRETGGLRGWEVTAIYTCTNAGAFEYGEEA